jgi:phytoene/squalene synthetase
MSPVNHTNQLATAITRRASKQTFYTIRYLVDREMVPNALRAYAYFRWVDDFIDEAAIDHDERVSFIDRQKELIDRSYRQDWPRSLSEEEWMLVDLIRSDGDPNSRLQSYIRSMFAVMEFDALRRGRFITQEELKWYCRCLAKAVTDALHHFIGNRCHYPRVEEQYDAATAAHVTHILRDMCEDVSSGFYNMPGEYLETHGIKLDEFDSVPFRKWVEMRVELARRLFKSGKGYLTKVENLRCRLAGFLYIARFEIVLDAIERDGYILRPEYNERKGIGAWLKMLRLGTTMMLKNPKSEKAQLSQTY